MNRNALIEKLNDAETLANGPISKRLLAVGFRYLSFQWLKRIVYPLVKKGKLSNAQLFFGQNMKVKLPAGSDLFLLGAKTHVSEIRLAKFLINHLESDMHFLDIGAHFGYFSMLAAALTGKNGKVVSLEASRNIYQILSSNTAKCTQCKAIHAAAGPSNGMVRFYDFPLLFSEYNTIEKDQYTNESWKSSIQAEETEVNMYSLNALIDQENINPSIIKIDVEGAEAKVLQGLDLTSSQKPIIIFEYIKNKPQEGLESVLNEYATYYELRLMNEFGEAGEVIDLKNSEQLQKLMDSENLILLPR